MSSCIVNSAGSDRAYLEGASSQVVEVEVNPDIPYPVTFGVLYSDQYKAGLGAGGFYGCSLSMTSAMIRPFNYTLVGVGHDGSKGRSQTVSRDRLRSSLLGPSALRAEVLDGFLSWLHARDPPVCTQGAGHDAVYVRGDLAAAARLPALSDEDGHAKLGQCCTTPHFHALGGSASD